MYYGVVNARYRLIEKYQGKEFLGNCLGMSPIIVPTSVFKGVENFDVNVLKNSAELVKEQYAKQKAFPSLLAVMTQEAEMMLGDLNKALDAGIMP
jgi:hypothetical protein